MCVHKTRALEQMARFHLSSYHFGPTFTDWCSDTNTDRLVNLLCMLVDIYRKARRLGEEEAREIGCNENEFTAYNVILGQSMFS